MAAKVPGTRLEPARSWIPPSSGSRMALSSMSTTTVWPTGDLGSTTCPSTRLISGPTPECGGRICTPVKRRPARSSIAPDPPPLLGRRAWAMRGPGRVSGGRIRCRLPVRRRQRNDEGSSVGLRADMPFYAWASVIVDGRVVATDYAPDVGWLVATRGVGREARSCSGIHSRISRWPSPTGWTRVDDSGSDRSAVGKRVEARHMSETCPRHRSEPGVGIDSGHCATRSARCDRRPGGATARRLDRRRRSGPRFDDLVTYCRRAPPGITETRRRDGRWLPREDLEYSHGR